MQALTMKTVLAIAFCCLILMAGAAPARAVDRAEAAKDATTASEEWLTLVDDGKFNGSWLEASTYFRNVTTKADWKPELVWRTALERW